MLKLLTIVFIGVLFYISVIHCELLSEYNDLNINETSLELTTENVNTDDALQSVVIDSLLNSKKLLTAKLEFADEWHWHPWKRKLLDPEKITPLVEHDPCEEHSSIDDFPEDLFTNEQRLQGAIILHFLGAIYFFSYLGVVINNFFIPSVQCICDDLKISPDIGAAVFMSTATAMPELFTNVISTFIADSDMGLGTVIGSLMFNILGVAAISSLSTSRPVRMDWWPVTRDCSIFAINVAALVIFSWDRIIFWYEAMILLILIFVYYIVMFQNRRIGAFMKRKFEDEYRCCNRNNYDLDKPNEEGIQIDNMTANDKFKSTSEYRKKSIIEIKNLEKIILEEQILKQEDELMSKTRNSLWSIPSGDAKVRIFWWFYSWPIRFILTFTTPNPKTWRKLYPLTFLMCIVWIAVIAYLIFWMLIIIGYTFGIPESVMGMTFLAIGGCTPEMITGVIMSRRGQAGTGLSNSIGASSLTILLSLGIPWLALAVVNNGERNRPFVNFDGYGVEFIIIYLLLIILSLYTVLYLSNFVLRKFTGLCLSVIYIISVSFALLIELEIVFPDFCS